MLLCLLSTPLDGDLYESFPATDQCTPPSLLHSLVEICLLNESLLLMHTVCEDEAR